MEYCITYIDRNGHRAHAILEAESGEAALRLARNQFDDVLKVCRAERPRSRADKFVVFMSFLGIVLLLILLVHIIRVFVRS